MTYLIKCKGPLNHWARDLFTKIGLSEVDSLDDKVTNLVDKICFQNSKLRIFKNQGIRIATQGTVNQNNEVSHSDRYVQLLQEAIKESWKMNVQVATREEERQENDSKMERLLNNVEELTTKFLLAGKRKEVQLHLLRR